MIVDEVELKIIPRFPNYAISKDGRVWSKTREDNRGHRQEGQWMKSAALKSVYVDINLHQLGIRHTLKIHSLILETYVGPCPTGMECRHLNGIRGDNRLDNLCWGTRSENQKDRIQHNTSNRGERNGLAKLTERDVRMIVYIYQTGLFSTQEEIANIFNINQGTISGVIHRKSWKHLWETV